MAPLLAMLAQALIGAGVSAAAQQATPKYGMTTPQGTPDLGQQPIDFGQLVGQETEEQKLQKLQLQNRLPPPY